jgi:predicted dehydrogenase
MKAGPLKIGVIGAGVFGNYHAAKCAAHPRHEFIGMFDTGHDRLKASAARHGTQAFDNCNELLSSVDAVIVACPAIHHGPIAIAALRAGRHVLVEKPIASNLETAQTMIDLAEEQNLVLQVGHQERFVARAIRLDKTPERPTSIHSIRFGPTSTRGIDVSVTLDLMTHDLDLAMWLMGERPSHVTGESMTVYSQTQDVSRADLKFPSGGTAKFEASRAEEARKRISRIEYPSGHLIIDFVNKTFENTTDFGFNENFADDPLAMDSLGAATDAFTSSILDGTPVAIPAIAGLNALDIALQIDG